ncbi:MAG: SRPBCC domain-containing protein [Acidobacteriia bacterium]|nr:SRPBCC domain-containing protein [Terriglobia bacterium]
MSSAKATPEQDAISREIEIAAPPERVFQALTDPKQLFAWWGKEPSVELSVFEMEARTGGRWRFRCKPVAGAEHGAVGEQLRRNREQEFEAHGEVLEYDPPRLLVWSWIANWHEHSEQRTVVRWELSATASGTRVRVTHSGLAQEPIARKDYGSGWAGVLQLLKNFF